MKRHAKASSAGSTQGRGTRLASVRLLVGALALFIAALGATAALAGEIHSHATLDSTGVPNTTDAFFDPIGATVDQSNGDVWVYDLFGAPDFSGAVLRFDAATRTFQGYVDGSNTPQAGEGGLSLSEPADIAIDNSGGPADGSLYVTDGGHNLIDAFDPATNELIAGFGNAGQLDGATTPSGSFAAPCGLAVDQSNGDLYVADSGNNKIWIYDQTGAYAAKISDSSLSGPCGLAFDSSGNNLYVHNSTDAGRVIRFAKIGPREFEFGSVLHTEGATDVTTDTADDHVFVSSAAQITEYDASGTLLGTFGSADVSNLRGLAFDNSGGPGDRSLYASDPGLGQVHVFGAIAIITPDAITEGASGLSGSAATVSGSLDPDGGPEITICEFEFGVEESYGQSAPCEPAGPYSAPATVSADITGLDPETTYHYRLKVASANGEGIGADSSFTTTAGPKLLDLFASEVGEADATINAELNPNGASTTYRFEYVAEKEFLANGFDNATPVPTPDKSIGSGTDPVAVSTELSGLSPATAYRYRVLAFNSEGDLASADRRLATFGPLPDFRLPDNRAWEMVSPPLKGGDVMGDPTKTRAALNGNAVEFTSLAAFADAEGAAVVADYIAQRSAVPGTNGWATHAITPRQDAGNAIRRAGAQSQYLADFSPDLSSGVYLAETPLTDAPNSANINNLYRRTDLLTPGYRQSSNDLLTDSVVPIPVNPKALAGYRPFFSDASSDFSHVLFTAKENLTADAPPCAQFPNGTFSECKWKLYEWEDSPGGGTLRIAGILPDSACGSPPCVASGSIPARFSGPFGSEDGLAHLRYSLNPISDDGSRVFFTSGLNNGALYMREDATTTTRIDVSESGVTVPSSGAQQYWGATPDGSAVFFSVGDSLFRYSVDAPADNHLTVISAGFIPGGGGGVFGFSDDGETVYYQGKDQRNLEVWRDGNARLIASFDYSGLELNVQDNFALARRESRVSPDGRYLLFRSRESLTGTDRGGCPAKNDGGRCFKLYLYDAEGNGGAGKLHCASCSSSEVRVTTHATHERATGVGGSVSTSHLGHALAEDGSVFFDTGERLVPEDLNGVEDVYEYDPRTGEQHLISSGEGTADSLFMDASPDGHDAFFVTRDRLSGWDVDKAYDLYDARVDGGLPEPEPAPTSCQGDACQPAPLALNDPTPASSTSVGPGDPSARSKKARRCPKGKHRVKARGKTRCVKRKSAAKSRANHDRRASR